MAPFSFANLTIYPTWSSIPGLGIYSELDATLAILDRLKEERFLCLFLSRPKSRLLTKIYISVLDSDNF